MHSLIFVKLWENRLCHVILLKNYCFLFNLASSFCKIVFKALIDLNQLYQSLFKHHGWKLKTDNDNLKFWKFESFYWNFHSLLCKLFSELPAILKRLFLTFQDFLRGTDRKFSTEHKLQQKLQLDWYVCKNAIQK